MTETEFIERWRAEKGFYEAWGAFVCDEIQKLILSEINSCVENFLKIPAKPRLKDENSLLGKAFHRGKDYADPYQDIEDKVGVRFVVLLAADIGRVSSIVEASDCWEWTLDKDFEADRESRPLEFSYQSKHYVVKAKNDLRIGDVVVFRGTPCELQIRTLLQHAHSELTHDNIYKRDPGTNVSKKIERTVAKSMALIEAVDDFFAQVLDDLEQANQEERTSLKVMSRLYLHFVKRSPFVDKTNALVLSAFRSELGVGLEDQLTTLLRKYPFISERIAQRFDDKYIFRQPWVLLVYYLVSEKPYFLKEKWPLTLQEIEPIFIDLGEIF